MKSLVLVVAFILSSLGSFSLGSYMSSCNCGTACACCPACEDKTVDCVCNPCDCCSNCCK